MKVLGVIPARFGSTRFPGKALAILEGKTVIERVYENAKRARLLDKVIIATDDKRIFSKAKSFGAEVLMTSRAHNSGTERVAEVARKIRTDVVVNIQGDEPFLKPAMIDILVKEFGVKNVLMATLATKIKDLADLDNPNIVKVVFDKNNYALYFSRSKIPYLRHKAQGAGYRYYKHIGIYAYRSKFLLNFVKLPVSDLEKIELLEQLRALDNGIKIKIACVKEGTLSIDTPGDLRKAKSFFKRQGLK
jgi:3-deoxy-manno-octulosonate cytidylyltransferase (CMP-KDO synthetase)